MCLQIRSQSFKRINSVHPVWSNYNTKKQSTDFETQRIGEY